ncbi:unnamed protein product [Dibothriocephalus latus]|uniref:Uncharacterized protein n=1 Tax=Dibothriocephalus latus TaxID=60516 RepID=A0A3P6PB32_DIBLA|nr:unnamed protein product [Dibothriocephalus latus]
MTKSADADFHGRRPAVYINQLLLQYLKSVNDRHVNRTFSSTQRASCVYQKWPTWHSPIERPNPVKRVGHLTRLSLFRTQYL